MNLAALEQQTWDLVDDDGTYYQELAVRAALNEAERLFCLITLSYEVTSSFPLNGEQAFYHVRETLTDWLAPRRLLASSGQRLRPGRLSDLDALNSGWQDTPGTPSRYAHLGLDFLAIYPQPAEADALVAVYAAAPPQMVDAADEPVIQENSHFALPNYAAYALRQPEGGQEFSKFLGYFNDFLDEVQRVQALVLAKNLDLRYEIAPFELERMDRSRLLASSAH